MTLQWFALLDGARVTAVVQASAPPEGAHAVVSSPAATGQAGVGRERRVVGSQVAWVDTRSLAAAKTQRIAAMRDARDAQVYSTFTWDGSSFQSDRDSYARLLGLRLDSLQPGFTTRSWRLADNTWRTLDAEDVAGVWQALSAHVDAAFTQFAARETSINACTTVAQVDSVTWES